MTTDTQLAAKAVGSIEGKTRAERIEALFRAPKFQFWANAAAGLNLRSLGKGNDWCGSGLLGIGQVDHFINRPFRVYQGHWPTGEIAQRFVVKINTARA